MLRFTIVFVRFAFLAAGARGHRDRPAGARPGDAAFPGANGKIAFSNDQSGKYEVYVMNADGSGQTNLTNNPASDTVPAWSPDGTKIAFRTERDGNGEIYLMNAGGTNPTNLTNNPASDSGPAWSPDGTKIAFDSLANGEVYVMNADGSGQTPLISNSASDYGPAWSPDGTKIAFTSLRDGNPEVYVMNANGSGPTNCTNNPESQSDPDWSPDGTKIAFTDNRNNPSQSEVYSMNFAGGVCSSPTNLTNVLSIYDGSPAWSPDGTMIAFATNRGPNPLPTEIYVMNANGSGQTPRTSNSASDFDPDWQPDADSDGVLPPEDVCPLGPGPAANAGCGPPGPAAVGGTSGIVDAQPDPAPAGGSERKAIDYAPLAAAAVVIMAAVMGGIGFGRRRRY